MAKIVSGGRTLYARNPEKNYAFEKVGEIAYWHIGKAIWIDGVLYTLTQEIGEEE